MNCVNWDNLEWEKVMPGMNRKVLHADGFTMVLVDLAPGLDLPVHAHPHEQAVLVLDGSLIFSVGDNVRTLGPGDVVRIPPDTRHGARVGDGPARVIDLFVPQRDEFPASALKK